MATIHCNIDSQVKEEAIKALQEQGASLNDAIQLFVTQIANNKGLPLMNEEDVSTELKEAATEWQDAHPQTVQEA